MKAVLFHQHGGPEVLQYTDFPTPEPGTGEVQVRLHFAALNRLDIWVRNGWQGIHLEYPHIPGADGAGEVVAIGDGVKNLKPGDRVVINANLSCGHCHACIAGQHNRCQNWQLLGETRRGTYAQYIVLPAQNLLPIPDHFDASIAAAAGLVFHTAWHSLIVRGELRAGESVLVVGASGGVNTASIQIAKFAGATVYVVGSDKNKLTLAESLGADYLIDRSKEENWSKVIYNLTNKRGVDVIVDNVGSTYPLSFRAAAKGGRILSVGNTGGPKVEIDNRYIFGKHLSLIGSSMGTQADFATVMNHVFSGKLRPVLGSRFELADARSAQRLLEAGNQMGKVILEIN